MSDVMDTGAGRTARASAGPAARSTPGRRLRALARAELTLLARNRTAVFTALLVPLVLPFSVRPALDQLDLKGQGLNVGTVLLTAAIGFAFLFAVYTSLVSAFVSRREELVLKRLRTGEIGDPEILLGTALPSLCVGLAQCVIVAVGCGLLLDTGAPKAPLLAVAGVLLGLVLSAALAAVTAGITKTVESAQVTALPLMFVSMLGSGMAVPLETLPDRLADVCRFLPLSPAVRLVQGGWTGQLTGGQVLGTLAIALAWTAVAVFAVQRRFRWEPRH
ncbi:MULTISPECIES: ABC transporter permease [Streptomyces]|uniref:Transport permease protein n=1 Tax=Streptomyces doudnae TaxID=3075536 RepID=A0ABD5F1F9_9ACTN|nr:MULTISPECIES: ABC transporter permease [unclassified Streptomyces]MDT0440217.1 ABC transporter permease [Streptomyces sp. DSM 41981]SCD55133.1 ABC-2 type transport system permease protein [Streptomyces sp. SolWspMP-5a-2]